MRYIALCCMSWLESRFTHDFQACRCGASFVDGGNDYSRTTMNVVLLGPSLPRRLEE